MNKLTILDASKILNNANIVITESYIKNKRTCFKLNCKICNNIWEVSSSNIYKVNGCKTCNDCAFRKKQLTNFIATLPNDYKVLTKIEDYKNSKEKIKFKHMKCGKEFYMKTNAFSNGNRCPHCNKYKIKTHKDFLVEFYKNKTKDYQVLNEYINSSTRIRIKHICGHEYEILPFVAIINNCAKCAGCLKKDTDIFKNEVYEKVGNEYEVLSEYVNNREKIKLKHNKCGNIFYMDSKSFLHAGQRCPICKNSKGETKIKNILDNIKNEKISYKCQYKFEDCRYKKQLPFDFAIFLEQKLLFLLEYDGKQHFEVVEKFGEESFKNTIRNDEIKNKYCKNNGIPLYRIPYYEYDNMENILNEILNYMHIINKE